MERILIAMLSVRVEAHGMVQSERKRPLVLIVEDEFLVRMDAVDMVRAAGFDVVEAENADEAILILERRFDIAIVFTDVQMPGSMDGLKLAAAVRGRWPPIRIMATSGLGGVGNEDLPSGSRFLSKPYSTAQINGALRELTAGIYYSGGLAAGRTWSRAGLPISGR